MPYILTASIRKSFTNPAFIITSIFLSLILFIRVTRGLDLTDEMQYYGEIKGLIETGRLFSNDLFIQQSVYLLFYPVFYLYHSVFEFDGLVFFGRLLMAFLSIMVFIYAYRKLVELKLSSTVASLTALSLTFSIPYHGIFAPSYNTISQILWIIFTLKFFEWKWSSAISWGILPIIMAFAHPTSAVVMSLLILLRLLLEYEYRRIFELFLVFLCGALIAIPVIFSFATPQEYLASLRFSSGYGVGTTFLSHKSQPIMLLAIYTMFGACLLIWRKLKGVRFIFPFSLFLVVTITLFLTGFTGGGYTPRIVCYLSFLSALTYAWSLSNISIDDSKLRLRHHWLVAGLLLYATTLGVTSGNGIAQATGAFMVGLPLLLGVAVSVEPNNKSFYSFSFLKNACQGLVLILFIMHWTYYPYREVSWWQANKSIQSVPEFSLINSSQMRVEFLQDMQHNLMPIAQGRRTLIVSDYPVLYFASGALIETCMLYMHSLTSDKSENILLNCLSKKLPEIVVDIFSDDREVYVNSRIKRVVRDFYNQSGLSCKVEMLKFNSIYKNNSVQMKYTICS